ncbi:MAG: phospho-sugar mutase [Flavobacteriales bacterium]
MNTTETVTKEISEKAKSWLSSEVDETTRTEVLRLLDGSPNDLLEAFYGDLEFGTGGLRGIMGVGTMRMNRYTVGMATQGLANYIHQQFPNKSNAVAIAFDSRNNSPFFAKTAADVLSANGIRVFLFDELRPTPLLSFAVRYLECQAGIVVTASHNPPEYNGYKVYWDDGAQVLPPHDKGIIQEVRKVSSLADVNYESNSELIQSIGNEVEEAYYSELQKIIHAKEEVKSASDLRVVYTSIHGAGITMIPEALKRLGLQHLFIVKEQAIPDGNFPTVKSPNPEEKEALDLALKLAVKENADLVLGTDPDTDRVGLAVRNDQHELVLLNGNQAACLLVYYELMQHKRMNTLTGKQYVAKTIVTTDLIEEIAKSFHVKWYNTLTGFKYIAGVIRELEGKETFIAGGEESYGYSVGEFVRDKDAVLSSVKMIEIAAWAKANKTSLWGMLMDIYLQFGLYHEMLVSITMKGLDGLAQINEKMKQLRSNPPAVLAGSPVLQMIDVQNNTVHNLKDGTTTEFGLPSSNVLQFLLEDGSKISARPSGTEPKIKFYFSLREKLISRENYKEQITKMETRMMAIQTELGL